MSRSVAVLLLVAMASPAALAAESAQSKASPQGDSWSSIAKLPDWSGVWDIDWRSFNGSSATGETAPKLTPEYAARYAQFHAAQKRGEAQQTETANCVPPGMPGIMAQPYPIEFLFTPGKVTLAIEAYGQMRRIFTDGRPQPPDPDPTFQGHSIGRWEGDTLVVDTVGFNEGHWLSVNGLPRTSQLHLVERFTRADYNTLRYEATIDDPGAYTQSWKVGWNLTWGPGQELYESMCVENNKYPTLYPTDDGQFFK